MNNQNNNEYEPLRSLIGPRQTPSVFAGLRDQLHRTALPGAVRENQGTQTTSNVSDSGRASTANSKWSSTMQDA